MKLLFENWRRYLLTESTEGLKNPYENEAALTWQGSGAPSVPKPEQMWDRHHDYESAATRVGDQVYDKAMAKMYAWIVDTLPKEGVLTGKRQGEQYEKFQREAFSEISPPEFETLEAFVGEYSRELDEKEERLQHNFDLLRAKQVAKPADKRQLPAPAGPEDIQMNEGGAKTKLLFENWRKYLNESKLRIFDFDDTLATTDSKIIVKKSDGTQVEQTPGEYAIYEPQPGDEFDFSQFGGALINPKEIKAMADVFRRITSAPGDRKVAILTARAENAKEAIRNFISDMGVDVGPIEIKTLGDSSADKKADWIDEKIQQGYNDIYFADDSHKNIDAVNLLKQKYKEAIEAEPPKMWIRTQLVDE